MFGHQDESQKKPDDQASEPAGSDAADSGFTASTPVSPAITPMLEEHTEDSKPASAPSVSLPTPGNSSSAAAVDANSLLDIKQQALQQLTPLVGHLEQSPEEKFRTTMMMIQASDNQDLLKTAYDAAQSITDEKAKAQALLDIVNEINYFTQHAAK